MPLKCMQLILSACAFSFFIVCLLMQSLSPPIHLLNHINRQAIHVHHLKSAATSATLLNLELEGRPSEKLTTDENCVLLCP